MKWITKRNYFCPRIQRLQGAKKLEEAVVVQQSDKINPESKFDNILLVWNGWLQSSYGFTADVEPAGFIVSGAVHFLIDTFCIASAAG